MQTLIFFLKYLGQHYHYCLTVLTTHSYLTSMCVMVSMTVLVEQMSKTALMYVYFMLNSPRKQTAFFHVTDPTAHVVICTFSVGQEAVYQALRCVTALLTVLMVQMKTRISVQ